MIDRGTVRSIIPIVVAMACGLALPTAAAAQDEAPPRGPRPTVSRSAPPSPNATVNLINLLVKQGVLDEAQAAALVKQADEEAYVARQAAREAATKAEGAKTTADTALEATSPKGTKRVTYVPEVVKKQIREDLRREVMAQAKTEGWAAPGKFPEWVSRIRFMGDLRVRYEGDFFPKGNDPYTAVNYNAINTGSPYNTSNTGTGAVLWPTYNVDQDRDRARLRARLGMEADLFDGFTAGLRIATGDTNAPVSFNQTLGGSGGNFSKYAIWLDRAFINYRPWDDLSFYAGRFDNPFFHPTDLVYHRDLGFDGIAAKARYEIAPGITPFFVAGVFPLYNTDFNVGNGIDYSTGTVGKFPSHDKWMVGAQTGSDFRMTPEIDLKLGVAYYDFMNVRGQLSSPCFVYTSSDLCDTDLTRPSFAQKGNTYMALRNIVPVYVNNVLGPQYQYFGLASAFRDVVLSGRLDFGHFHPVHVVLDGEYVQNVAWDRADIAAKVNANPIWASGAVAPCPSGQSGCNQVYEGGNVGWLMRMTVGYKQLKEFGDWNFHVGYKYLESDAVIDAFADSDFGLGGTNLKGYFVGANLALGQNVWASARWMSANQVAGAPYAVDIIQVDLNARF
ncbi:putative porin [Rhodoplanes azumiensis]|uniref:Porin n=1 Tax=Rhodoplanes azumiensis TaxID=1897628 RepID=A0ABW5AL67_9BRAD